MVGGTEDTRMVLHPTMNDDFVDAGDRIQPPHLLSTIPLPPGTKLVSLQLGPPPQEGTDLLYSDLLLSQAYVEPGELIQVDTALR